MIGFPKFGILAEAVQPYLALQLAIRDLEDGGRTVPCCGADAALWTSDDPDDRQEAVDACAYACPVLQLCREYATAQREKYGVLGGTDLETKKGPRK